jgi:aminomethyltransferase
MKRIALHDKHIQLGGKMVEFAGFEMPIQYKGIIDEHNNVRNNVGVFDVSHMGEFIVKGDRAKEFVQYITSNDVTKMEIEQAQYSCFPNHKGGIVDDLLVYKIDPKTYMLVVNGANIQKDWDWVKSLNTFDVELEDISDKTSLLAVQGPNAQKVLEGLTDINLSELKYYTFKKGQFAGCENVLISATGYTGAGGFEVYFKNDQADKIWTAIFDAGKDYNIEPAGLGCRDTLRLEMGYCLYGNDIDDNTSPLEAGLGWITKLKTDFINKDYFVAQKENGLTKKLVGFELLERGIPRKGYTILNEDGQNIGVVTSGTMSPSLHKPIGMGYVVIKNAKVGEELFVEIRNKKIKGVVTKFPFYKN